MPEEKQIKLPIMLRQSIVYLAMRVIILQILFAAIYLFLLVFFHLLPAPSNLKFIFLSLSTAIIFIPAIIYQIVATALLAFTWLSTSYVIRQGEVVVYTGLINKKEKMHSLRHIETITCNQSWLEQLLGYGTVRLYNPFLRENIDLLAIRNPLHYVEILEKVTPMKRPATGEVIPPELLFPAV